MSNGPHPRDINLIKGLSERRRLPRLGKIRLGIKKTGSSGEFPAEVDYFVSPPEVQRVYGPRPKALRIMIPLEDTGQVFPQAYKWYGSGSGLKCKGDGQAALRRWADVEPGLQTKIGGTHDPNDLVEIPCPCPRLKSGDCGVKGHLMVLLPDVSLSGIYQIDTGSSYNIIEVNSSIDFLRSLLGHIAFVPLTLKREPTEITYQGKRRTHYLLKLTFDGDLQAVQRVRETASASALPPLALPVPSDEGNGTTIETTAEVASHCRDASHEPADSQRDTSDPVTPTPPAPPTPTTAVPSTPPSAPPASPAERTPPAKAPNAPGTPQACACGVVPSQNVADYSQRYFGEVACLTCQKKRFGKVSGGKK